MRSFRHILGSLLGLCLTACPAKPPPSQFPDAAQALSRLQQTFECSRGIGGEAKVDYFGDEGRIRANALFQVSRPESVRFDIVSPFGAMLSTLTSNGQRFNLLDLRNKQFIYGPANQCTVSEFMRVPVPPHALVQLLSGQAPILTHEPGAASIEWTSGAYSLTVLGKHDARETIRLVPVPADYQKPWQEQRLRVLEVLVVQEDIELYRAEFQDHKAAKTAGPRVDPDGLEPDMPPSGPQCSAEVPRKIRFVIPGSGQDVMFLHQEVHHNPPFLPTLFQQQPPGGVVTHPSPCAAGPNVGGLSPWGAMALRDVHR